MSRFRDFLYLDEPSVDRLISGIEGGLYDDTEEAWSNSSGVTNEGAEDSPIPGPSSGSSTRASASETRRRMRQNAEARFSRLWRAIEEDEEEELFTWPASNASVWEDTIEGQFCRIVGRLSIPPAIAMLANSAEILQLGRLGQQLGIFSPDADTMQQLETMTAMKEIIKERMPVVVTTGERQPPIALPLQTAHSRVGPDMYIGQATIYGRVVERVERGAKFELLNMPGSAHLPRPNREERRQSSKKGTGGPINENELPGPALVLRTIAITQ